MPQPADDGNGYLLIISDDAGAVTVLDIAQLLKRIAPEEVPLVRSCSHLFSVRVQPGDTRHCCCVMLAVASMLIVVCDVFMLLIQAKQPSQLTSYSARRKAARRGDIIAESDSAANSRTASIDFDSEIGSVASAEAVPLRVNGKTPHPGVGGGKCE